MQWVRVASSHKAGQASFCIFVKNSCICHISSQNKIFLKAQRRLWCIHHTFYVWLIFRKTPFTKHQVGLETTLELNNLSYLIKRLLPSTSRREECRESMNQTFNHSQISKSTTVHQQNKQFSAYVCKTINCHLQILVSRVGTEVWRLVNMLPPLSWNNVQKEPTLWEQFPLKEFNSRNMKHGCFCCRSWYVIV